jgi:hypothetical protein
MPDATIAYTRPTYIKTAWSLGVAVTNNGRATCTVIGFPVARAKAAGSEVTASNGGTEFGDPTPVAIVLPPGKSVAFNVQFGPYDESSSASCAVAEALAITLPGDVKSTSLEIPPESPAVTACAVGLRVSSFYPPVY